MSARTRRHRKSPRARPQSPVAVSNDSGQTTFLTREGFKILEEELEYLRTVRRAQVAQRLRNAQEKGELIDDWQYEDAKNEQAFVAGRVLAIEALLTDAVLIDESTIGEVVTRPEEEFIGIGLFGNKVRLISLSKDGEYSFIDGTNKLHSILYIATSEALAMKMAVEELEDLVNDPKVDEATLQDFFERNPQLILNDEYKRAYPHITLMRDEGPLIPDFLLEPVEQNALCDILDLKLPTVNIFVLKKSRMRFSAAVLEACAQLREYNNYFDDKQNRDLIFREYGLMAYRPKMIVIVGRRGNVDPVIIRKAESDVPHLIVRTYDDILSRAKARLQAMK